MESNDKNLNILIRIADVEPIALTIPRDEEATYREAEKLVNTLWNKWTKRFNDTSNDVLARVAFQFARLYLEAYGENRQVNEFLSDLDQQLDALLGEED